jgi:nucleoside-diphosphate-sugar epimerase
LQRNNRIQQLEEAISTPSPALVDMMKRIDGDIMILGIGGKIGVTLGMSAFKAICQAGVNKRVTGVSRFSDPEARVRLEQYGIETTSCDLMDPDAVRLLPEAENIIFMAGKKFGTSAAAETTWALNTIVPGNVASRYRNSRIVAFSTGCVYELVNVCSGGSKETDLAAPVGEYAQSTLARERIFEYYSLANETPVCLVRLNYAIDLRYGVLRDIGDSVYGGQPVDVTMGYVNVIWQGDSINQALLCLEHCSSPPFVLNVTGPEILSVRDIALEFGRQFSLDVNIVGKESETALLSDSSRAAELFGKPAVTVEQMISWTAEWIKSGGPSLNKPSHFQTRDGNF